MYYHDPFTVVASFLPPAILVCLVVQLVLYLLGSAGLYAMANNTGMKNPWTAWIPIARDHLLGSLADRYNCSCRQKKSMLNVAYRFKRSLSAAVGAVGSSHFDFAAAFL